MKGIKRVRQKWNKNKEIQKSIILTQKSFGRIEEIWKIEVIGNLKTSKELQQKL